MKFWKTLNPPDIITAVLCAVASLLIFSRMGTLGFATAATYGGYYLLVLAFILAIVPLMDRTKHWIIQNPVVQFVRYLYPAIMLGIFFNWTEPVSHMFFSEPFDALMIKADMWLFGFNPGKELAGMLGNNYYLSEFMNLSYLSYYLTPWLPIYFYFAGKQKEFYYSAFAACLVIFTCFIIQSVFPVQGPIYNDPSIGGHLVAGPISAAAANFLSGADVPGSAMPSGHVAGTMTIFFLTWIMFRKAFWVTAPMWISLCISTVYGHFHYAIDAVAGFGLAVLGVYVVAPALYARFFPELMPDALAGSRNPSPDRPPVTAPNAKKTH